jgi:hypothetical protein
MTSSSLPNSNERTTRAEEVTARLAAMPLMEEAVFHSLRFQDGKLEKEVCDIVLCHRGEAILLSLKAQDTLRDAEQTARWLNKRAPKALGQLRGAYRTLKERETWCQHLIHGRRDFPAGSLRVRHGVALFESASEVTLTNVESRLRDADDMVATTLMSVQNFTNIVQYLRTWRDVTKYLEARHACLRPPDSHTIGADFALFGYYTAMRDTFDGCAGIPDAKIVTARGEHVRGGSAFRDKEVALASILEDSMRGIATAGPVVLPAEGEHLRRHFSEGQVHRDRVREELCELSIQERAALGEQIAVLSRRASVEESGGPFYGGVRFTRHPSKAYVVAVARNADHAELGPHVLELVITAGIYHERPTGIGLALNQIGDELRFNWYLVESIGPSVEMLAMAEKYWGHIRLRSVTTAR